MSHYDYVKLPDGSRRRISSPEDIDAVLAEWGDYIEKNWVSPQQKLFDPESKVKYMLEGLGNIILRPDMSGMLTEYQKMKIEKYEIPISACGTLFDDEIYSRRPRRDVGESEETVQLRIEEAGQRYDEEHAARIVNQPAKRKPKKFLPTRRQKIEAVRRDLGIIEFDWVRVDTNNMFFWDGKYWHIPDGDAAYMSKPTRDGEVIYDMDQVLCGKTRDGGVVFHDMNIELLPVVELVGEQTNFLDG